MNTDEDISKQVENALDTELASKETELAERFGAVETNTAEISSEKVNEIVEDLADKGKEEKYTEEFQVGKEEQPAKPKKLKPELILDILKLQTALGITDYEETKLKRLKKDELVEILKSLTERGITKAMGLGAIRAGENEKNLNTADLMARNLYGMNLLLCRTIEALTGTTHATYYTGNNVLEGWSQSVSDQRDILVPILTEIYLKNKIVIDKCIDPIYKYFAVMLTTMATTVAKNTEKKK